MMISAFLLPALVCGTAFFINFIAIYYHASRAIPFTIMVRICFLFWFYFIWNIWVNSLECEIILCKCCWLKKTLIFLFFLQLAVVSICTFVILPLTLVGTVLGRNLAGQPNYPCRINAVPRPIPEKKWFMEQFVIIPLGGILPFGSIFIEMLV